VARHDLISVVEASYDTHADDPSWLAGVLERVDTVAGRGLGCCGFFMDASDLSNMRMRQLDRSRMKIDLDPRAFSSGSASDLEPYFGRQAAGTGSGQIGARAFRKSYFYNEYYKPAGAEDVIGIIGVDSNRVGCVIAVPCTRITRLDTRERAALSRLAAHLATGLRLRATTRKQTAADVGADAVLDVRGKVLHADGEAKSDTFREALRQLARQIDRARSKLRRSNVDEALAVWTALVEARWTLLDHFDSDGRRLLVARRNEPPVPEHAVLTTREQQVLAFTALGHSGKLVSYTLGLSPVAVSRSLASAMAKLGLRGRAELATALARFAAAAVKEMPKTPSTPRSPKRRAQPR
jgi:DNA-binding NarL/FixJ family response regulator